MTWFQWNILEELTLIFLSIKISDRDRGTTVPGPFANGDSFEQSDSLPPDISGIEDKEEAQVELAREGTGGCQKVGGGQVNEYDGRGKVAWSEYAIKSHEPCRNGI